MQKVLVALVVGASLGVLCVVAAMAWKYQGVWLASIKLKGRHTRDEYIDISNDEEFSIGSLEIPNVDHIESDKESEDNKEKRMSLTPEYPLYDGEGRGLLTLGIT
ncbi:hypothetical protein BDV97DRAFT_186477 [Delphinella strobiligena]|nr:hypothetical protein BDV97DRAFT_186477 [Delphinella strobiligena]